MKEYRSEIKHIQIGITFQMNYSEEQIEELKSYYKIIS